MPDDIQLGVRLTADSRGLVGEVRVSQKELDKLKRTTDQTGEAARRAGGRFVRFRNRLRDLRREGAGAGSQFGALKRVFAAVITGATIKKLAGAAVEFQRIDRAFKAVFGSASNAREEFAFVEREADRLGLRLLSTASSYAKIAAAARGTVLEGGAVRDIFLATVEAGTALGLSADGINGALTAFEQIISKGKVSAEELRGQLGERLPGAFQIAARALGITTQELDEQLALGTVLAEDLLPKLAREFRTTYGADAVAAADEATGAQNRFFNALDKASRAFGESGFLDELAKSFNAIGDTLGDPEVQAGMTTFGSAVGGTLKFAVDNADALIQVFAAIAGAKAGGRIGSFFGPAGRIAGNVGGFFAGGLTAQGLLGGGGEGGAAGGYWDSDRRTWIPAAAGGGAPAGADGGSSGGTGVENPPVLEIQAVAEQPAEAIDAIREAMLKLRPELDQNIAALNKWRDESVESLDENALGYQKWLADIENIYDAELARIYEEDAERQRAAAIKKLEASDNFADGFRLAAQRLRDDNQSVAEHIADAWTNGFQSMEDALVEFVTEGQIRFGDFVDSILADIARLLIQRAITNPLANALGNLFPIPGGSAPSGAPPPTGMVDIGAAHSGGIIGHDALVNRRMSAAYAQSVFANAARYHSGGIIGGEVPAILQRGEEVLTRNDPRHRFNQGSQPVTVEVINQGTAQNVTEAGAQATPDGLVVQIITEDLRGNGPVAQGIGNTFNVKRRVG